MNDPLGNPFTQPDNPQAQPSILRIPYVDSPPESDPPQPLPQMDTTTTLTDREKDIAVLAKSYEPLCGKIVSVLDGAGARIVVARAKRANYSPEFCEKADEAVRMTEETKGLMKTSSARICARHVNNPEYMDYIALTGALLDWGSNIVLALRELKKDETKKPANIIVHPPAADCGVGD